MNPESQKCQRVKSVSESGVSAKSAVSACLEGHGSSFRRVADVLGISPQLRSPLTQCSASTVHAAAAVCVPPCAGSPVALCSASAGCCLRNLTCNTSDFYVTLEEHVDVEG